MSTAAIALLLWTFVVGLGLWLLFFYDNGLGGFERHPSPTRPDELRSAGRRTTVRFDALDETPLEGWLFEPRTREATAEDGAERVATPFPLVLMAPGPTTTKESGLEFFAWRFVESGLAVLLFDFRTIGGSDGMPRRWIDPFRQRDDYRAAIRFARDVLARDGRIDGERIALWGTSLSAGAALVVAAEDPSIRAVVAQTPLLSIARDSEPTRAGRLRRSIWTMLDLVRASLTTRFGLPLEPVYVPGPGRIHDGPQHAVLARGLARFDRWKPLDQLAGLRCPVYLVAALLDDLVPLDRVEEAHARLPRGRRQLSVHDVGHYDLFMDPMRERNASLQAEFLTRQLAEGVPKEGRSA